MKARLAIKPVCELAQSFLKLGMIKELEIELPSRLARLYERKLAALEALKKSLLHQALTGEL